MPIEVVKAKGTKHLTKAEIYERQQSEIKPISDNIIAPDYLTKKQQKKFDEIASKLKKLKIMGETDVDTLARYITANDLYVYATKKLRSTEVKNDIVLLEKWTCTQERYFKMVRACAQDLGLTISSRCRLVVPATNEEEKHENKFSKFEKVNT